MQRMIIVALVMFATAAQAQSTFTADAAVSKVKMTLNTTHEVVNGNFQLRSANLRFAAGNVMSGSIVVSAASGATGNSMRDHKMTHSILDVDKFADVTFEPKSYTGTLQTVGDSTITVAGTMTLLGTQHAMTVPARVHMDAAAAKATAHFDIPYVQWGLKDPSFMMWKADKTVALDVELNGKFSQ